MLRLLERTVAAVTTLTVLGGENVAVGCDSHSREPGPDDIFVRCAHEVVCHAEWLGGFLTVGHC